MPPYWRRSYLREGKSLTLNDTYTVNLLKYGRLGSILLEITGSEKSAYGQSGGAWRIVDQIDKIEIIANGSETIKSFTGEVCQALSFFDQGVYVPSRWRNYATNMQAEYFLINFGRYLNDPLLQLDLGRFDSVELKITNSASSTTDFSGLGLDIILFLLQDADAIISPGYIRTEEWRKWTTAKDETTYLELPTKYKLRRLILQAKAAEDDTNKIEKTNMYSLMDDIDLSFDSRKVQFIKGGLDHIMIDTYLAQGRECLMGMFPYHTAGKGIRVGMGFVTGAVAGAGDQAGAGASTIPTIESARTSFTQKPLTYEAQHPMTMMVKGYCPGNCVPISFDWDGAPENWLDPSERAAVNMDIHCRDHDDAVGGTNRVILDRLVSY